MKMIEGHHLTATRRRAIRAILARGLTAGRVGRTTYRLADEGGGRWRVQITANETDCYGRLTPMTDRYLIQA